MASRPRPRLIAILGPTGIGKTELAVRLAGALGAEIVVADSRQVYRRLDIATNKPSPGQRARARFHMIDVADPAQSLNVHDYVIAAGAAVEEIAARGRPVVLEGGTGLYVDALLGGYSLAGIGPRPERRGELDRLTTPELVGLVRALDPQARVDPRNRVRLIRAIEVLEVSGAPLDRVRRVMPPNWQVARLGLAAPREVVGRRLDHRVDLQLARGLVEETASALESGVPPTAPVLTGIGYAEAIRHLRGELSREELAAAMRTSNRRYAKRQMTWLRRDGRIRWFEVDPDPLAAILRHLEDPVI